MTVLSLRNVTKNFGETEIIRGVSLDIEKGEKHAIIGPNGAGKSTLFHLISGLYSVTGGSIKFKEQEIQNKQPYEINRLGLARSFQVTNIFARLNVFENVRCALLWSSGYKYSFWHLLGRQKELNEKALEVLEQIGLMDKMHFPAGELAYAHQRALELGIAIASGAEVIMLDEPVAGMSHSEAENAVELIRKITAGKTLIMVEHDMNLVSQASDRVMALADGQLLTIGSPQDVQNHPEVLRAYLGD